jgi:hypothetical protein
MARVAGGRWRILVHDYLGRNRFGVAHHVASDRTLGGGKGEDSQWEKHTEIPDTEFDELVIGNWIHLEQMSTGTWWMNIAGVTVWVKADRDGRPKRVTVYGPDTEGERVPGCEYRLWDEGEQ